MRIKSPKKAELASLDLLEDLLGVMRHVRSVVIGGWCTTAYAGNIRYTADIDMLCESFSHERIIRAFDKKDYNVKPAGFGVRAKHNETGIEIHMDAGKKIHDASTDTDIEVPEAIFDKPRIGSVRGILNPNKVVDVPVCDLEFFMVLKGIPGVPKHDYDFAMLLTQLLNLRDIPIEYNPRRFAKLLTTCAADIAPFREKEARLRDRSTFMSLQRGLTNNLPLDAARYRRVLVKLEEIDRHLR
jgi:hypothetical protein